MPFKPGIPPYLAAPNSRRCSARSKQTGEQCKQIASPGRHVCRFHGGWSLRGRDHPAYQHGEYTKATRERLKWLTQLGVALRKLERAETGEEQAAAEEFAQAVLRDEPEQDG